MGSNCGRGWPHQFGRVVSGRFGNWSRNGGSLRENYFSELPGLPFFGRLASLLHLRHSLRG